MQIEAMNFKNKILEGSSILFPAIVVIKLLPTLELNSNVRKSYIMKMSMHF
jgi:hypothetical protein